MQYKKLKVENWKLAIEYLEKALSEEPNQGEIRAQLEKAKSKISTIKSRDAKKALEKFTAAGIDLQASRGNSDITQQQTNDPKIDFSPKTLTK